ncbi:FMP45 [[Candida] subhashii]|uniref:FMP45 n=1 Tax=[Candida] subhashii TaxID=561895 RepID=A0A8J5QEV6_9ASCO|nr:FMP45 [[Candida] subhashii]KAG7660622.1 FMP45 [[Candida] subhashii]
MGSRYFTIIPLIFLISSTVFLIFTILNGSTTSSAISALYWSETDTSRIPGAPFDKSRWTFYTLCGVMNGHNVDCLPPLIPAFPYSPDDNFPFSENRLPPDFVINRNTYYYLSRISFSFLVMALAGSALSLLITPFGFCFKSCVGASSAFFTFVTFVFGAAGASCLTAVHARGRNHFNENEMQTNLGVAAFGILWAGVLSLLLAFIASCLICCVNNRTKTQYVDAQSGPGAAGEPVYYPNNENDAQPVYYPNNKNDSQPAYYHNENNKESNHYEGATYVDREYST